jgi:predicted TIM-barrel fold metal-dependent hydrolase
MTGSRVVTHQLERVDMHFHVGLRGDQYPHWGHISSRMRRMWPKYDVFLLYAGVKKGMDVDQVFMQRTLDVIDQATSVDRVVCLALDYVWDKAGNPLQDEQFTDFWVSNEYVLHLQQQRKDRILFGASVHPYRKDFRDKVREYVDKGAVFLKWLPSAQQFTLADPQVRDALKFLATVKDGGALPLLLHVGVEYAVPTTDERTRPYDYLSWGFWDKFWNFWRRDKWHVPNIPEVLKTLDEALAEGAVIIIAHCGLPYFVAHAKLFEHDDFPMVKRYLKRSVRAQGVKGKVYADLSACATPFRQGYFKKIAKLPADHLLFGSDFPTPVFELSADWKEVKKDFKAMLAGHIWRIAVPQDNPINVNYRELSHAFPGHAMFGNFDRYFL